MDLLIILAVGLAAGTISGIVGFGSSIMLMPVLVIAYGPQQAVPVMTVAALLANASRVAAWWREVRWRACATYAVTAVPAAALGAGTLVALPARLVELAIGIFFIAMIVVRRALEARQQVIGPWQLAFAGAIVGYLTGIVVSTGPITAPIFLALGLVKGAFLATEAAASLAVYLAKAGTFRTLGALPADAVLKGLIIGTTLMAGAFIARRFVLKFEPRQFRLLMAGLMLVSGAAMIVAAW